MIRSRSDHLFCDGGDLRILFSQTERRLIEEIESSDDKYILNVSEIDLINHLCSKYEIQSPLILDEETKISDQKQVKIDVSKDKNKHISDRRKPFLVDATEIIVSIPISGNGKLLNYRPSTRLQIFPVGEVYKSEIQITYRQIEHRPKELKNEIRSNIELIKQYLGFLNGDIEGFNHQLREKAEDYFIRKKKRLLEAQELVSSLDIPISIRSDTPKTYAIPVTRKKLEVSRPIVKTEIFTPEPALAEEEYEIILGIIKSMVSVIEKSPKAFGHMNEEDLRTHFLVQLNGHYKGSATGETFNFAGKTDILISHEDKNVFIAECKYWSGGRGLSDAIDQLLSYLSWRDTKTAILLFNRNKSFSAVLDKIHNVVESHENYKKDLGKKSETEFRYIFSQKNDSNREIYLTIMAFDVPC